MATPSSFYVIYRLFSNVLFHSNLPIRNSRNPDSVASLLNYNMKLQLSFSITFKENKSIVQMFLYTPTVIYFESSLSQLFTALPWYNRSGILILLMFLRYGFAFDYFHGSRTHRASTEAQLRTYLIV